MYVSRDTRVEESMSTDVIDRGQVADETDAMRRTREALVAKSPPPRFFALRAQLLAEGRSNQRLAETENMYVNLKVYAGGGENGLHNHTDEDHFHLVLSGRARFFGPRGEARECGAYEGILLPAGCFYRFHAIGEEPLVLLRVGAKTPRSAQPRRMNVYGQPLPNDSKENGHAEPVAIAGAFWGASA
jgi:mannose-6-phosphate isomerase-like protein (cupin superfamily)